MANASLKTVAVATALSASLASIVHAQNFGGFLDPGTSPVGDQPFSVAVGSLNTIDDDFLDVAVANQDSGLKQGIVSVLLGNGDGTFQPQMPFEIGDAPYALTLGDLNNDNVLDVAVAQNVGTVTVLFGVGDGTFDDEHPIVLTAGSVPTSVAIGDLNGDPFGDLVVANRSSNDVSVFLSNGDGTFQEQPTVEVGIAPYSVAIVDADNDGVLDLAVANTGSNDVSVLRGNGDGTFEPQQTFAVGGIQPVSLAVGDLNADGNIDLATANRVSNDVSVLLGDGNGMFAPASGQPFAAGMGASSVAIGDMGNNCALDLVVANRNDGTVSVLLGDGDGAFEPQQTFNAGMSDSSSISLALGDFNGSGVPDVVVALEQENQVASLINQTVIGDLSDPPDEEVDGEDLGVLLGGWGACDPASPICTGDLNCDGAVDGGDLGILLGNWTDGEAPDQEDVEPTADQWAGARSADLTADGVVDSQDLAVLASRFGPADRDEPADLDRDGVVDGADVELAIVNWGQADGPAPQPTSDESNVPWVVEWFGFDSVPEYIEWVEALPPQELWQHIQDLLDLIQE